MPSAEAPAKDQMNCHCSGVAIIGLRTRWAPRKSTTIAVHVCQSRQGALGPILRKPNRMSAGRRGSAKYLAAEAAAAKTTTRIQSFGRSSA